MNNKLIPFSAVALFAALGAGAAHAAAPADWGKVPSKKIILFYPGVSPIEWITKGTEHSGFKGMKKGERCLGCHGLRSSVSNSKSRIAFSRRSVA